MQIPPQTNTSRMQLPSNGAGRFLSARAWAIATASNQLAKRRLTCSIVIGCTEEQIRKFSIPSATASRRQKWRITVENYPKVSRISGRLLPISIHNVHHVEMALRWPLESQEPRTQIAPYFLCLASQLALQTLEGKAFGCYCRLCCC
jgi:hypothetical protein